MKLGLNETYYIADSVVHQFQGDSKWCEACRCKKKSPLHYKDEQTESRKSQRGNFGEALCEMLGINHLGL